MNVAKLRSVAPVLALAALALLAVPALAAADEPAAADPRADLLAHLERTQKLFLDSIAGLSEAQWSWKPAPDKWSVGECAEHITRTEPMLRGLIVKMLSEPTDPAVLEKSHGKVETILTFIVDRSSKVQAPEPLNPMKAGEVRARPAIERDFPFERGRSYEIASTADLLGHAMMSPVSGEVDALGWLYFLSGHVERHTLQIEEVKATPGFPKS
jgi:hypothetical protein